MPSISVTSKKVRTATFASVFISDVFHILTGVSFTRLSNIWASRVSYPSDMYISLSLYICIYIYIYTYTRMYYYIHYYSINSSRFSRTPTMVLSRAQDIYSAWILRTSQHPRLDHPSGFALTTLQDFLRPPLTKQRGSGKCLATFSVPCHR